MRDVTVHYTTGIGASKDDRELLAIGSDPDHSSVFIVKDFNDLTPHIGNMIGGICAGEC